MVDISYNRQDLTSMAISPMICRYRNHDYDGDSLSLMAIQSEQARNNFKHLFTANNIKLYFDPDSYLPELTHEAVYALWALTKTVVSKWNESYDVKYNFESFQEIRIKSSELTVDGLSSNVYVKSVDKHMPYLYAAMHAAIYQFGPGYKHKSEEVSIYGIPDAGEENYNTHREEMLISVREYNKKNYTTIFDNILLISNNNIDFMNRIWKLELLLTQMSTVCQIAVPTFSADDFVITSNAAKEYKQQFVFEPVIGYHQNMYLFDRLILPYLEKKKEGDNILYKVFKSGSRLKKVQLMKSVASSGIPTDVYGRATGINVSTSLLEGLKPLEMFKLADGARLALAARESLIPKAGESQRIIMSSLGFLILDQNNEDCGCTKGFKVKIKNEKHLRSLQERNLVSGGKISKDDTHLIGQEVEIFSPLTCKAPDYKICKKCWGGHLPPKDKKGYSYLGALASSAIVEQLLQSSLRLHHTGGAWQLEQLDPQMYDILARSDFENCEYDGKKAVHARISSQDMTVLESVLLKYYEVTDIDIFKDEESEPDGQGRELYYIVPHIMLRNQDASRILKEFATLVYKKREKNASTVEAELIPPLEMYEEIIDKIFEGAYLLSVYVESILSVLFFDEDNVNMRYTDKEISKQIPLKNTINELSPKLNIFYKLSPSNIKHVYERKSQDLDHMYFRLTEVYQ